MNLAKKCLILLSLVFLYSFMPNIVLAESSIHIKIEEGYDGTAKSGRGYPIEITLENNGGDFAGELLIPFMTDYNLGGTKLIQVDLPANSKKVYKAIIPGHTNDIYHYNTPAANKITLFEGDRHKGKKVKLTGKTELAPNIIDYDRLSIGILSENSDRLKALQLIKIQSMNPKIVQLNDGVIPEDSLALQFFDLIVVDDYPINLLSEEQQQALISWVKDGGTLIAGASAKGHHSWGQLESLLPINITDETNINDLAFLSVGEENDFNMSSLKVGTGTLQENAKVKNESGDIPVVAYSNVGKGEIWQVTFSLGEDPIADWNDYHKWLESLIGQTNSRSGSSFNYYESNYQATYYSLGHINELFPVSQFSIGTIILIMLGYLVIIVPILYFILLRKDKREHAWWIIPVLSIVVSFGIFGIGAKDRLASPILAELGMYATNEDGDLSGEYTFSIFSNTSGDYQVSIPRGEFSGVSVKDLGLFGDTRQSGAIMTSSMLTEDFYFPNVEYWSARSVVGQHTKMNVGKFDINLELADDHLTGTIDNLYPYDFEQVYIWSGSDIYELGNLKQGDSLKVSQKLKGNLLMRPVEKSVYSVGSDLEEMKVMELESTLVRNIYSYNEVNSPIVLGYTRDNISNVEIVNKNEKNDRLSLIYMPFIANGSMKGEFTLRNDQFSFDINAVTGQVFGVFEDHNYIDIDNGIYDVTISLPAQIDYTKAEFESIRFNLHGNSFFNISLFNQDSGEHIEVVSGLSQTEVKDDLTNFVSSEGKIIIRIEKNHPQQDPYVMFPEITVKGAVK